MVSLPPQGKPLPMSNHKLDAQAAVKFYDKDKNGSLNASEFSNMARLVGVQSNTKLYNNISQNSGQISVDDLFKAYMAADTDKSGSAQNQVELQAYYKKLGGTLIPQPPITGIPGTGTVGGVPPTNPPKN